MIKLLIIFVILIQFATLKSCPISKSDCLNIVCKSRTIACENDYSIDKIPVFNITKLKKTEWYEIIIRNTNINRIYSTSFKDFENSSKIILLDLSNNQIDFIENGAFMPFKNSIRKLVLNNNKLIEFQFDSLLSIRLEELFINNNNLKDFHVVDNNNNTKDMHLTSLYLNRNNLSILPISIKLLTSLKNLDLSFNPFLTLPNHSFNTLISLKMLNLNGLDSLCCVNSETFSGLNNLRFLYLTAPSQIGLEPNICWFNNLIMLTEFSYNITTYLQKTRKQNVSLENTTYNDYCNNSLCWIYLLTYFKNISVINPNCILVNSKRDIYQNSCKIREYNSLCELNKVFDIIIKDYSSTISSNITSTNNNNIILGSVLGSVIGFLVLIMITSVLIYYKRKRKCCFKEKKNQDRKNDIGKYSPDLEFNRNNPLYFNNHLVRQEAPDDDYLNNIGGIVNIIELSDSSLTTFDFVDNNTNANKNVRFDSNVLVISNLSNNDTKTNDNSLSSENSNDNDIVQKSYIKHFKSDVKIEDTSINDTVNSSINTRL